MSAKDENNKQTLSFGTFHVNSTQKNEHPLRFQRNLVYTYLTISYITTPNFSPIYRMAS